MLTFDEAAHVYHWNGAPVPNVTRVLKPLIDYSMVNPDMLEIARQKGVAVHKMVEAESKGDLTDLPEWMVPVYDYWLQIVGQMGLQIIASERRVYHPAYGYAGTLDLRVVATKCPQLKGHGIIDIKRSFMGGRAIAFQTAAYVAGDDAAGYYSKSERVQWRAALRLREDMPPRFEFYEDRNDFNVFLAFLTVHKVMETCK